MTIALPSAHGVGAAADHALACVAAFFDEEASAREAAALLPASVALLLGPAHSGRLGWSWRARRWAARPNADGQAWFDAPAMTVLAGAGLAALAALSWLLLTGDVGPQHLGVVLGFAVATGALLGRLLTLLAPQQRQQRRFDGMVRRQLAAGRWAVLAHGVPPAQRAGVLALLRGRCVVWCSVSVSERWV